MERFDYTIRIDNNKISKKELELLNGQLIGIILFIFSLIISAILIINDKRKKLDQDYFFNDKQVLNIALLNRLLVVLITIYFVYNSYQGDNKSVDSKLEITSNWLNLISSLIFLYIILKNYNNNFDSINIETPTL